MVAILLLPREDPALPILILEVDITIINSVIMCHEKLRSLLKKGKSHKTPHSCFFTYISSPSSRTLAFFFLLLFPGHTKREHTHTSYYERHHVCTDLSWTCSTSKLPHRRATDTVTVPRPQHLPQQSLSASELQGTTNNCFFPQKIKHNYGYIKNLSRHKSSKPQLFHLLLV